MSTVDDHDHRPVTAEELVEIERLDREATPGPWAYDEEDDLIETACGSSVAVLTRAARPELARVKPDGRAIAAYRSAAPRLARDLAAERAKRAEIERAEIERFTAELAACAPADASFEALGRIVRAAWVEVAKKEAKTVPGYVDLWKWLEIPDADTDREIGEQVVRAVDASRPAATTPVRTFPRITLGSVAPGSLIELAPGDLGIALVPVPGRKHRPMAWVATGLVGDMHESATVSLRATPAELDALTSADVSRPGPTEEQARAWERLRTAATTAVEAYEDSDADEAFEPLFAALDEALAGLAIAEEESASRGEAGPDDQVSRGETGPAAAPVREIGARPADFASMHDEDTHPHRPDPISLGERGPWDEEDEGQ